MRTIALIMRAEVRPLADVLFGKGRGAILALLYGHPDQSFYYRQITRQLNGLSVGTLQRELETLSQLELIDRSTVGKQVFYRANRSHPAFGELRALVLKTVGAVQVLRSALASMAIRISVAFIYGSMARQEAKAESDIDLLIVGHKRSKKWALRWWRGSVDALLIERVRCSILLAGEPTIR